MAAKLLAGLEEALERSPGRLLHNRALGMSGGSEWVAAEVVVHHPEALEGVPGRHLERSILGGHLLLVKGGVVGVRDDCVGRGHDDCLLFGIFYYRNSVFMVNRDDMKMTIPFYLPGSNDNLNLEFLKNSYFL